MAKLATPSEATTFCSALVSDVTRPISARGAALSRCVLSAVIIEPMPAPIRIRGRRRSSPVVAPLSRDISHIAATIMDRPNSTGGRAPKRSNARPLICMKMAAATACGKVNRPVSKEP